MKQISDVIVVGSGIVGAATVFALANGPRRRITLIEKGPLVSGMTRRTPGLAHPFHAHPGLIQLAISSYSFYSRFQVHFGKSKSGFVETGAVVFRDRDGGDTLVANVLLSQAVDGSASIDSGDLAALFPGTATDLDAIYTSSAGYADAVQTASAMIGAAKEAGVQVFTGTQVRRVLLERDQVKGVETTTGEFEAPAVVLAAGAWSERLLAPLGIAADTRFRRGIVQFYEQPAELPLGHPIFLDSAGSYFLRPHPYHMSAAGRVNLDAPAAGADNLDESVTPQESANVNRFAQECIPAFGGAIPKRAHSVLYTTAADGLPVLGAVPKVGGLYVAAGFGAAAFAVAPAVGQAVTQLVMDRTTAEDISLFSLDRPNLNRQI